MKYIIEAESNFYVKGERKKQAVPTVKQEEAHRFDTIKEANDWAEEYMIQDWNVIAVEEDEEDPMSESSVTDAVLSRLFSGLIVDHWMIRWHGENQVHVYDVHEARIALRHTDKIRFKLKMAEKEGAAKSVLNIYPKY